MNQKGNAAIPTQLEKGEENWKKKGERWDDEHQTLKMAQS